MTQLKDVINLTEEYLSRNIPYVDEWEMTEEDCIYKQSKGYIYIPVSKVFNVTNNSQGYDCFILTPKRCYNGDEMRNHIVRYMNYFIHYYDLDSEIITTIAKIKYMIDFVPNYDAVAFKQDIVTYVLSPGILYKVDLMVRDNYQLNISKKNTGKKNTSSALQYDDKHARILLKCSLLMNICIPMITHFIYSKTIEEVNDFILNIFDPILHLYDMDVFNKLYETSYTSISHSSRTHNLWDKQDIRGKNPATHAGDCVENIILQIMPKYVFNRNIVCLNYDSIDNNNKYQIIAIGYEFDFISLSGSNKDEDNNSEFDKFEAFLTKSDENLYIQNKVNCEQTMKRIRYLFGPFNQDQIKYYTKIFANINNYQKNLIFNLFYKYFGNTNSIKSINLDDYAVLILAAKKLLMNNNLHLLSALISGKIIRLNVRKSLNKKEEDKIRSSPHFRLILEKYGNNPKIIKTAFSLIATLISSEFAFIDYYNTDIDGQRIEVIADLILEEVLLYILLI